MVWVVVVVWVVDVALVDDVVGLFAGAFFLVVVWGLGVLRAVVVAVVVGAAGACGVVELAFVLEPHAARLTARTMVPAVLRAARPPTVGRPRRCFASLESDTPRTY